MESFLRRYVKKTCKNIEFIVGTVVGVDSDHFKPSKMATVSYKMKDDVKIHEEPAFLFVGTHYSYVLCHLDTTFLMSVI